MRTLGIVLAAVTFLISAPTDGVAQESLTGNWELTVDTEGGIQVFTVSIVQDGEDLKATGEIPDFGEIEMNGTRDGDNLRLALELDIDGNVIDIIFLGTLAEDGTIAGTTDVGGLVGAAGQPSGQKADDER